MDVTPPLGIRCIIVITHPLLRTSDTSRSEEIGLEVSVDLWSHNARQWHRHKGLSDNADYTDKGSSFIKIINTYK